MPIILSFLLLLLTLAGTSQCFAGQIIFQGVGSSRPVDKDNLFIPDGGLVQIGKFTSGFDPSAHVNDPALLRANFTTIASTAIFTQVGAGNVLRPGSINKAVEIPNILGTRIYVWIYNAPTVEGSTQQGLFSNPQWIAPGDAPPTNSFAFTLPNPTGTVPLIGGTYHNGTATTGKLTAIAPTPSYTAWASTHFNSTQLANAVVSGDDATPVGDGVSNLLKYAFGLPPLTPIPSSARPQHGVVPITGSNYVGITFRRNRSATDLVFEVQFSSSNGSWPTGASTSQTVSTVDLGDGSDLVTVRDMTPLSAGQPARLARVKVTRN